ncbi:MAG: PilZ domain-containing protein [Planctomycetota bacterium]
MPTALVVTAGFNFVVLALTPVERWKAAGRFNTNFMTEHWFVLTGAAAIIILTALLLMVSYNRAAKEQKLTEQLFAKYAKKRGLSRRERQILLEIARKAGLKRGEAIFTMGSAFNRGAAKMIEESLGRREREAEKGKSLRTELSFLREKLGFQKKTSTSIGSPTKSSKLSSRQIPAGKKLHITRHKITDLADADIESTVAKNDNMELTVKLATPLKTKPGERWRARYHFGASVWEFDTSIVSCNGNILVLSQSDNVRFINRRRFLRVPVNKPAFIARFPFIRTLPRTSANASDHTWGPPEFIPAVVTELGGPGLRIEARLEVKVGERILIAFSLDEAKDKDAILHQNGTSLHAIFMRPVSAGQDHTRLRRGKTMPSRIIEDIGEVRHVRAIENGLSIAVELTGLSDSDVNELIRATNAASVRESVEAQDVSASAGDKAEAEKVAGEPAAMQGV